MRSMRARAAGSAENKRSGFIRWWLAPELAQQSSGNNQRATERDRRVVHDVAHRLKFFLSILQSAFEIGDVAPDVFQIQADVFPGILILLQLDPAVGPETDLLAQPLVDGGECLVDVGDAPLGDFVVMLGN